MKILTFETEQAWLDARLCKITGSRLKDIVVKRGTGKKLAFYELIAERIGIPSDGEDPMARGHRLEIDAIDRFIDATGKKVDPTLVLWTREDDENIAVSPDGVIDGGREAVECKALSSARHLQAYLTKEVPDEYHYQVLQYFLVSDKLERVHVAFLDPRLRHADFFYITVERSDMLAEIEEMMIFEKQTIAEVEEIVAKLTEL